MDLIGPNFLALGADTATKDKVSAVVRKLRSRAAVVFNNDEYALRLAIESPGTLVIARRSPPGHDSDDNAQLIFRDIVVKQDDGSESVIPGPENFVDWRLDALHETARELGVDVPGNIAVYVNNEAVPNSETFRWLTEVGRLLVGRGVKGVLGNWANTWPTVDQLQTWEAREYTRLVSSHPGLLWNGSHEYAPHVLQHSPPWYLGQWQKWVKLAQEMEIPPPNIIITEFGWDGETKGIRNAMDEMPDTTDRPKQAGQQAVEAVSKFHNSPYIHGVCWFCVGVGRDAKKWRLFDALEFDDFWDVIAGAPDPSPKSPPHSDGEGTSDDPVADTPSDSDTKNADTKNGVPTEEEEAMLRGQFEIGGLDGRVLNVRREPAGEVVDRLRDGDVVVLTGEIEFAEMDGERLVWREMLNGFWIADVVELVQVVPETVDKDALRRQLVLMRERFNVWVDGMMELIE